jgi:hypothetical protein
VGGFLVGLLKIGGVTALTIGVFYLLYRQILSLRIFSKLGSAQTLFLVSFVAVLVWLTAMTVLIRNDQNLFVFGNYNHVEQGFVTQTSR